MLLTYKMNVKPGRSLSIAITFFVPLAFLICAIAWSSIVTGDLGLDRNVHAQSLTSSQAATRRAFRYRVRGRVVDQSGRPVAHARIVVDAGPPTSWEDVSYFVESDESGRFLFYDGEEATPNHIRFLYVTGPVPGNARSPIMPPFNRIPSLRERRFASRRIKIRENAETDLGDVRIQVSYGAINVRFRDVNGRPLVLDEKAWTYVWLRVRNQRGQTVKFGSFSISDIEASVNLADSSAKVALPEGTWYIEGSLKEDKGPWLTSGAPIQVGGPNRELYLTLRQSASSGRMPTVIRSQQESKARMPQ